MKKLYKPVSKKVPKILHGADYFPEQWLHHPETLDEDIRLMKLAKCNVMSIGMFAWSKLEPEEGVFTFEWLDEVLGKFAENGIYTFSANFPNTSSSHSKVNTPSSEWLDEVLGK